MRVVLDTNVWVSALITPTGTPATLLGKLSDHVLIASEEMLEEVQRVLQYDRIAKRYGLTPDVVSDYLANIREKVELVAVDLPDFPIVEVDSSDDKFLVGAVKGKADCIVSGDRHLLGFEKHRGIPIVSPSTLLAFLESESSQMNGFRSGV
jgi:putative PIN family toxin of toxin-antitoxin system